MSWSEEDIVKFVELYREHQCLWNTMKPSYRNNQMRVGALEKIVEEMVIEGLRNTYAYNQQLQKTEKSRKSNY